MLVLSTTNSNLVFKLLYFETRFIITTHMRTLLTLIIVFFTLVSLTACSSSKYAKCGKLPKSCSKARHKYYDRLIQI